MAKPIKRGRKLALMRRGQSLANAKYGIGGRLKEGPKAPRQITLPKLGAEHGK